MEVNGQKVMARTTLHLILSTNDTIFRISFEVGNGPLTEIKPNEIILAKIPLNQEIVLMRIQVKIKNFISK